MALTSTSDWARDVRSALIVIERARGQLRQSEQLVADYVTSHAELVVTSSVSEVARGAGTSEATVVRFARALGYQGFPELKLSIARDLTRGETTTSNSEPLSPDDPVDRLAFQCFQTQLTALSHTTQLQQVTTLQQAVDAMVPARSLLITGAPTRTTLILEAERRLAMIGLNALGTFEPHRMAAALATLQMGDVVLAFPGAQLDRNVAHVLKTAAARGATTIAVSPTIAGDADQAAHVSLHVAPSAIDAAGIALESIVAEVAFLEMLLAAVAVRRHPQTVEAIQQFEAALLE